MESDVARCAPCRPASTARPGGARQGKVPCVTWLPVSCRQVLVMPGRDGPPRVSPRGPCAAVKSWRCQAGNGSSRVSLAGPVSVKSWSREPVSVKSWRRQAVSVKSWRRQAGIAPRMCCTRLVWAVSVKSWRIQAGNGSLPYVLSGMAPSRVFRSIARWARVCEVLVTPGRGWLPRKCRWNARSVKSWRRQAGVGSPVSVAGTLVL